MNQAREPLIDGTRAFSSLSSFSVSCRYFGQSFLLIDYAGLRCDQRVVLHRSGPFGHARDNPLLQIMPVKEVIGPVRQTTLPVRFPVRVLFTIATLIVPFVRFRYARTQSFSDLRKEPLLIDGSVVSFFRRFLSSAGCSGAASMSCPSGLLLWFCTSLHISPAFQTVSGSGKGSCGGSKNK
jgi:hypothetical protein